MRTMLFFMTMGLVIAMLKCVLDVVEAPKAKKQGCEPLPPLRQND